VLLVVTIRSDERNNSPHISSEERPIEGDVGGVGRQEVGRVGEGDEVGKGREEEGRGEEGVLLGRGEPADGGVQGLGSEEHVVQEAERRRRRRRRGGAGRRGGGGKEPGGGGVVDHGIGRELGALEKGKDYCSGQHEKGGRRRR